jgi:hypothetical protein
VHPNRILKLQNKTKFRLSLELYFVVFGLLASQVVLLRNLPLDLLAGLLAALYGIAVASELKTRREPFTRSQKHVLFGLAASFYGIVVAALLIAALVKRTPLLWIMFGLAAIISLVTLLASHEQMYKD